MAERLRESGGLVTGAWVSNQGRDTGVLEQYDLIASFHPGL